MCSAFLVIALRLTLWSGRCCPAGPTPIRCGSRWPPTPPTSSTPHSHLESCAWRALEGPRPQGVPAAGGAPAQGGARHEGNPANIPPPHLPRRPDPEGTRAARGVLAACGIIWCTARWQGRILPRGRASRTCAHLLQSAAAGRDDFFRRTPLRAPPSSEETDLAGLADAPMKSLIAKVRAPAVAGAPTFKASCSSSAPAPSEVHQAPISPARTEGGLTQMHGAACCGC